MKPDPCGKIRYDSQVSALLALKSREVREVAGENVHVKRAYYCRRCFRWHLTSRPAGVR